MQRLTNGSEFICLFVAVCIVTPTAGGSVELTRWFGSHPAVRGVPRDERAILYTSVDNATVALLRKAPDGSVSTILISSDNTDAEVIDHSSPTPLLWSDLVLTSDAQLQADIVKPSYSSAWSNPTAKEFVRRLESLQATGALLNALEKVELFPNAAVQIGQTAATSTLSTEMHLRAIRVDITGTSPRTVHMSAQPMLNLTASDLVQVVKELPLSITACLSVGVEPSMHVLMYADASHLNVGVRGSSTFDALAFETRSIVANRIDADKSIQHPKLEQNIPLPLAEDDYVVLKAAACLSRPSGATLFARHPRFYVLVR